MTITAAERAEISRQNSRRSTGPRSPLGKSKSRMNAIKHGCRAKLPIIPGEDPDVYRERLDSWVRTSSTPATPSSSTWSSAPSAPPGSSTAPTVPSSPASSRRPTARRPAPSRRREDRRRPLPQAPAALRYDARLGRRLLDRIAPLLALRSRPSRVSRPAGQAAGGHCGRLLLAAGEVGRTGPAARDRPATGSPRTGCGRSACWASSRWRRSATSRS